MPTEANPTPPLPPSDQDRIASEASRSLRHNIRCSVIDGSFFMVMVGLAETFFPLFILALFDSPFASGLILTLPLFIASLAQLLAPHLVRAADSYRKVVVASAWLQAIICLPLALIAFTGMGPLWLVFALVTIYHFGTTVGGAPWTALMGILVPQHIRPRFFAKRNRLLQVGSIAGVVIGACFLEFSPASVASLQGLAQRANLSLPAIWIDRPSLPAFGLLFLLAGVARVVSAIYLSKHHEPHGAANSMRAVPARELLSRVRSGPAARFIALLCTFQFAMMIGSPFWTAYVREHAGVTFLEWAGLIIIWMMGRALAVTWAGEVARNHGHRRLLVIAAALMTPIPALWALSTDVIWLAIAQLLAGMAIACWELSVWLSTLDTFDDAERTSMLAKFGLLNWLSGTAGSSAGGSMLTNLTSSLAHDRAAFAWVFITSTIARALVAAMLWKRRPE